MSKQNTTSFSNTAIKVKPSEKVVGSTDSKKALKLGAENIRENLRANGHDITLNNARNFIVAAYGLPNYDWAINRFRLEPERVISIPFYIATPSSMHNPQCINQIYLQERIGEWLSKQQKESNTPSSVTIQSMGIAELVIQSINDTGLNLNLSQVYWDSKFESIERSIFGQVFNRNYIPLEQPSNFFGQVDTVPYNAPVNTTVAIKNKLIPAPNISSTADALALIIKQSNKGVSMLDAYFDFSTTVYLLELPSGGVAKPMDRIYYRNGCINLATLSLGFVLINRSLNESSKYFKSNTPFNVNRFIINYRNPKNQVTSKELAIKNLAIKSPAWGRIERLSEQYRLNQEGFESIIGCKLDSLPTLMKCNKCLGIYSSTYTHDCI